MPKPEPRGFLSRCQISRGCAARHCFVTRSTQRTMPDDLDRLAIDTIRTLSIDAVEKATSGHPGTPMALAPVMYTLWQQHLRYDPADARWQNRDRFILSAGHASMLLYSTLFLADVREPDGEGLTLEDIKNFRQLNSK